MKERVFYLDAEGTSRPACSREHGQVSHLVDALVHEIGEVPRFTGAEFLATRTGSKRIMYTKAKQELGTNPRTLSQLAELKFFTKWESTVWSKPQVPRIISPRSFGFNYLLGKYIRPLEHRVFESLQTLWGSATPVVSKGLTQQEKASAIVAKLASGYVCVGLDASRFDQTIGAQLLKLEHSVYNGVFKCSQLRSLLRCQLDNKGRALCRDGMVSANIGAMRCSGDQNTSLGNCIISCLLAKLYCEENGILDANILNDGDDLLLFLPEVHLEKLANLTEWYLQWGLRMKVEPPAYWPEQVEYCQSRPVYDGNAWVLVRNPLKALNTDYAHDGRVKTEHQLRCFIRSVGLCGLSMTAGIPVFQEMYHAGVRLGSTGKVDKSLLAGLGYQAKIQQRAGFHCARKPVLPEARESFEKAFGLTYTEQISLELRFASMELGRHVGNSTPEQEFPAEINI
nr:MAG: RNA-dependent RNA polymerase [Chemarfal virus 275]